jgi:hypothetical protein
MRTRAETKITRQLRLNLVMLAKAYAKATGKTLGSVSNELYKSRKLLPNLAKGVGTVSIALYGFMIDDIRAKWPADKTFPLIPVLFIGRRPSEK